MSQFDKEVAEARKRIKKEEKEEEERKRRLKKEGKVPKEETSLYWYLYSRSGE
jgi:hypothetical protein